MYGPKPKEKVVSEVQLTHEEEVAREKREAVAKATKLAAKAGQRALAYEAKGERFWILPNGRLLVEKVHIERIERENTMAKTVKTETVTETEVTIKDLVRAINGLAKRVEELENAPAPVAVTRTGRAVREYTDEERKAIGVRLQTARAEKLGLTYEELRYLKLRPGVLPTAAQIKEAKAAVSGTKPAKKVTK